MGWPHSTTIWCVQVDGRLYVGSYAGEEGVEGEKKYWERNVARRPAARLRIDGTLYDVTVTPVAEPELIEALDAAYTKKYDMAEVFGEDLPDWWYYSVSLREPLARTIHEASATGWVHSPSAASARWAFLSARSLSAGSRPCAALSNGAHVLPPTAAPSVTTPACCANSSPHRRSLRENPRSPPSIRCCWVGSVGLGPTQRNVWFRPTWSLPTWQAGSTPGGQGLLVAHVEHAIPIANPAGRSQTAPPGGWAQASCSRGRRMASSQHPASGRRDRALPPGAVRAGLNPAPLWAS